MSNAFFRGVIVVVCVIASAPSATPPADTSKPTEDELVKNAGQEISTANVQIEVSAEGQPKLPPNSRIEWQGVGSDCQAVTGHKALGETGSISVSLPVCKVRLTVLVPSFTTQAHTVDLIANRDKLGAPIQVTLKRHGPMEFHW